MGLLAGAGLITGMLFSYFTRAHPYAWLKGILTLALILAFIHFFAAISVTGAVAQVGTVEVPLAGLFILVQIIHSFDVPARKDLVFSLVASAILIAVGAAQAVSISFALFIIAWVSSSIWALSETWKSMSNPAPRSAKAAILAGITVIFVALVAIGILPPPQANAALALPYKLAQYIPLPHPGGLAGGGLLGNLPASPEHTGGATRVGGFLGFAGPLNEALRGNLSNNTVLRVRTNVPGHWVAETYDTWSGTAWTEPGNNLTRLNTGSPFSIPQQFAGIPFLNSGMFNIPHFTEVQTFYLAVSGPNLIFAANYPSQVWFPSQQLYIGPGGSIRTPIAMTPGTIYTVVSKVPKPSTSLLQTDITTLPTSQLIRRYTQLPRSYKRVRNLAESLTMHQHSSYMKILTLEHWIRTHIRYSTDIPPLLPGQDAVNQLLFSTRIGYCEQISTALAVMLRSLGIPVREAVGYIPGSYNPLTDLYDVKASDAHAWVQVWFSGIGWLNFDPTANVPRTNPNPGSILVGYVVKGIKKIPPVPTLILIVLLVLALFGVRYNKYRPRNSQEKFVKALELSAARLKSPRRDNETLRELANRIQNLKATNRRGKRKEEAKTQSLSETHEQVQAAVNLVERTAYGEYEPNEKDKELLAKAKTLVKSYPGRPTTSVEPE